MTDHCHDRSGDLPDEVAIDPRNDLCADCQTEIWHHWIRYGMDIQAREWTEHYRLGVCDAHRTMFHQDDGCQDCAGASAPLP
jgi:hypothetical protein